MKKNDIDPNLNEENNELLDLASEDGDSSDEDIDLYENLEDTDDEDEYDKRNSKASHNISDEVDEDEDDEDSESEEVSDEPSPFDGYDDTYGEYTDEDSENSDSDDDIDLNSIDDDDEDISDDVAEAELNSQYIEDANAYLETCGLEPCAADWVKMSLESRQEITKKLAEIRDNNWDNKQIVNAAGNALFFLNIKFFLRVCHRKVQKHSSGGQDYQNKVQSALADIWEFCSQHWLTYDPNRATYTTYMSPAKWKVTGFAVGSTTERLSDQTANKFAQIRKAENEIARETGCEEVDDLALQLKTHFPQKVISDYRAWCKSLKSKQLDENMPASKGQLEKAEYMRNPEEVVAERNQKELVINRIKVLFPNMSETDLQIIKLKIGYQTTANTESIASMLEVDKEYVSTLWNRVRAKLQKDREISILISPGKAPIKHTLTTNMLMSMDDNTIGIIDEDEELVTGDTSNLTFTNPDNNASETGFTVVNEDVLTELGLDKVETVEHNLTEGEESGTDKGRKSDDTGSSKRKPGRPKGSPNKPKSPDPSPAIEHDTSDVNKHVNSHVNPKPAAKAKPVKETASPAKGKKKKYQNSTIFEFLDDDKKAEDK